VRSPRRKRRATDQPLWRGGTPDRQTVYTFLGGVGLIVAVILAWLFLRTPAAHDASPAWSLDGQRIVFVSDAAVSADLGVIRLDGTGRDLIEMPGREGGPAVSPDGESIAFDADQDGNRDIYVVGWDGRNSRPLTTDAARDWAPSWMPDGNRVVFMSDRDTKGGADIYRVSVKGGPVERLTRTGNSKYPRVSPDGASLAFEMAGDIHILSLTGGRIRRLTYAPQDGLRPAWSPDGRQLAFVSLRNGRPEIFVVDFEGSNVRRVVSMAVGGATDPQWSPDGTRIAFVHLPEPHTSLPERPAHAIYTVELATGRLTRLSP
jgi:Tol biopolymer transport system component